MTEFVHHIAKDGTESWLRSNKLHRENGPALITNYFQAWCYNDQYHREDGPAVIWHDGVLEWYIHGKHHREDGPAWFDSNGECYWYLKGKPISTPKQFQKKLKLTDEEMAFLLLKYKWNDH